MNIKMFSWMGCRLYMALIFLVFLGATRWADAAKVPPKMSEYFGIYEIYEIKKLEGGITPDEKINQWKGARLNLGPRDYSVRKVNLKTPTYKLQRIELPKREGEVVSRELTYFYGIEIDRKSVCRVLVFEGPREKDPIGKLEILSDGRLVDIYDGRAFFYRKLGGGVRKPSDDC